MGSYDGQVPAVSRAVDVLELVASTADGVSTSTITERVDGSRSGLYAVVNTLKAREWLVQDDVGNHRIGPGLRRVAGGADPDDRGLRRALEAAGGHATPGGESLALVRPDGDERLVIAVHDGDHRVRSVHRLGGVRTGAAADEVALRPDRSDDPQVSWPRPGVARTGDEDLVALSSPVCRDGRRPVAAVVVEVPAQRADHAHLDQVAEAVEAVARATSLALGAPSWQPWGRAAGPPPGPPRDLDEAEVDELLHGHHAAQLACLRHDGTPHTVPLWFDWDGKAFWLTASPGSAWAGYVRDGSPVSLTIEEPWPDLRRVFVAGRAEAVGDTVVQDHVEDGIAGLRRRLLERSVGHGGDVPGTDDATGWTAIRVVPERMHGRAGLGSGSTVSS